MKILNHKLRFDQRLFVYFFFIFLLFATIVSVFQYQREKKFRIENLEIQLSDYNTIIHNYIHKNTIDNSELDSLVKLFPDTMTRITIMNRSGDVLYDSFVAHEIKLENHINRPEVQDAIRLGKGSAVRHSTSTGMDFYYVANKFPKYYIRSALPYNVSLNEMLKANPAFLYFMLVMFIIVVVSLIQISNRIGKSISRLRDFAQKAENNDKIPPNKDFPNDELGEISAYIVEMYKNLHDTKNVLIKEREKIYQHLQIAQEGLAIFTSDKKLILSNTQFLQYFDIIAHKPLELADEVFKLREMIEITGFINRYLKDGEKKNNPESKSITIQKGGHTFIVRCIVFLDNTFEIAVNDITLQEKQNLLKRQLTQNISHELKTPVSSIQGYLETIIANPDLDQEKLRFFIDRSHQQAIRLTQLLQDISLLNKIEEASSLFEREMVYVNETVRDVLNDVSLELSKKHIRIENDLTAIIMIKGNRSLLYSIFRSLVDNTLSYAGEDIAISIQCYREDDDFYYFPYYDTGCGVPDEHLPRLFHRFYRVDSGRSRKLGGTGLGLAIVKNGILFHQGKISARNRPEGGLEFLFSLTK